MPFHETSDRENREKNGHPIIYYQWVNLILIVEAVMFYMPMVLWRTLNNRTGIDMNDVIETCERIPLIFDVSEKKKRWELLAQTTQRYLHYARTHRSRHSCYCFSFRGSHICYFCHAVKGSYISYTYIFVKLLFLVNVFGQLLALNFLLGQNFTVYGVEVAWALYHGHDWTESERFPRVTMCDIDVRRVGNVNTYTVQCVLSVNFFNEKIFLYLWWWYVFVGVCTLYGLIVLLYRIAHKWDQKAYIYEHISSIAQRLVRKEDEKRVKRDFVFKYLQNDGVLLARLIGHNTSRATVSEYLEAIFKTYVDGREKKHDSSSELDDQTETQSFISMESDEENVFDENEED